ncbi:LytR C-terminal domain-containing protein [Bifidobacterium parmae]|uniref:Cell wall integrity and stress response protein 1 n=1 Tax=Bifidobacterium parmae TaxID=361854 RepID=A0A2N5J467_9BIFI|nr:LytR C-terminal domain-containing protein [Bifidobacterium parmae]PLS29020.1 cell wall integrity and stress response protein 1 [Bifidobacterium parmae]
MAKNDKDEVDSFEPDAFDNPPKGPAGMHRGARSAAARFMPFVVVVLVAALCGVGAWGVFSGEAGKVRLPWSQSSSTSAAASSSSDSAAAKKKAASAKKAAAEKKAAEEKAAQEQQAAEEQAQSQQQAQAEQQAQQAAQPDKTKGVTVINGTGISGYAATKQNVLASAGYTNVAASNPTGSLPSATVVWYESEADKATADDVASTLGISNVQQASGLGGGIVVVLMS